MPAQAQGIQSVEIAASLLAVVAEAPGPLRLKDLADTTGLAANKARMYLVSLMRVGLVAQDEGLYIMGPKALRWGLLALNQDTLFAEAQTLALHVSNDHGSPVLLSAWDMEKSVIVAAFENGPLPMSFRVGGSTPLDTATGTVFAAFLPDVEAILRASVAPEHRDSILERVSAARENGWVVAEHLSVHQGVTINGYGAVAVPLLSRIGRLIYVMTALYPMSLTEPERADFIDALNAAARRFARAHGA